MVMTPEQLKRMVFPGESGGDYNALFGYANRPGGQFEGFNLTDMTVNQALQFSNPSGPYAQSVRGQIGRVATPMGAYQVVGTTLRDAAKGLGLTGNERMTPELQDQIGMWIYQNQGPGAWEAWGGGGGGSGSASSGKDGAMPMGLFDMQEEPQTFGQRLKRDFQSGELMDRIALAANSLRLEPDQNLAQMIQIRQEKRGEKEKANRTLAFLRTMNTPEAVQALQYAQATGDVLGAAKMAFTPKEEGFRTLTEDEVKALGLPSGAYQIGGDGKISAIGGGNTTITMPGDTLKIMPDGSVLVADPASPDGFRIVKPKGSKAEAEAMAAEGQAAQKEQNTQTYETAAIKAIDKLIGVNGKGGIIDAGEGLFNLSNVGIVGKRLADLGVSQEAVDVRNTLKTVTSNIAFSRLQAMRDASATGGALGSVTENELDMLMSSLGAIQQDTSAETLRENLPIIREIWMKIQKDPVARRVYASSGGAEAPSPAQGGDDGITTLEQW